MAILRRKKTREEGDNNIFWTTMSDLMLGLAIIFIAMFVLAMTGFTQNNIQEQQQKMEVTAKIEVELAKSNIDAKVDRMTGDVEIPAAALFDLNSSILTPEGKQLLNKLAPIYVNSILGSETLKDKVQNISVQGYTDSQSFAGVNSVDEQFLRNMELSLERAKAVAEYMLLHTKYDRKYSASFRKKIIVEGNSFNNPVLVNGKEDFAKSRRVELKLKVKSWDVASALGLKL